MTDNLPDVTQPGPATMFALIERMAANPEVDIAKLQALLDMQERLMARDAEREFNESYAQLQSSLPRIGKKGEVKYPVNKANPDGPQRHAFDYARYEDIDELIRPLLNAAGFSLTYNTEPQPNGTILVKGSLLHVGGHAKHAQIGPLPLDSSGGKNNLQAAASTFSYGKRYCATMLLNLVFDGEDDDGVRGGIVYITAAEVAEIEAEILARRIDKPRFLEFLGVAEIANIQAKDKAAAMNALAMKRRHAQAGGPPEAEREGLDVAVQTPPPADNSSPQPLRRDAASDEGRRVEAKASDLPASTPHYPPPGGEAAEARGGSGKSRAADAADITTQSREAVPDAPRGNTAPAAGSPTDIVGELGRKLTAAAQQGQRALDAAWIKLTPHEQDLARPMRPQYREIAQQAGSADAKQK